MDSKSVELASEQTYFDLAAKHRAERRAALDGVIDAAANAGAAQRVWRWVRGRKEEADRRALQPVAIGRFDSTDDETWYIGHELITDDDHEPLVINWRTPAARPFYDATPAKPCGVVRKRTFTCDGNTIIDFEDLLFAHLAAEIADLEAATDTPSTVEGERPAGPPVNVGETFDGPDAALLAELDRARTGTMHDIVATIRAAQYALIRAPLEQLLVIEGGPGTGKTAIALHRVSYLLFNERQRLAARDVLIIGPSTAFTRYTRHVLPDLGDTEVQHTDIGQLAPPVPRGRAEPIALARLKGDLRMAGLLARALAARIGSPERAERLLFDGRFITLTGVEVAGLVTEVRQAPGGYAQRRRLLRERLLELAQQRGAPLEQGRHHSVDNLVERLWPQLSAAALLRGLFGSTRRLTAANDGQFSAEELAALHRRSADRLSREVWTEADLALLDEADALINGVPQRYAYIVVDEAQDLSPMQLRSIARRSSTGCMTVVGDLTQSTGPNAHDGWPEILRHLPTAQPQQTMMLRYIYRVPRRVYELAARLLPLATPAAQPGQPVREGPAEPGIHRVTPGERGARVVALATEHAAAGRYVGLVCPPAMRAEVEAALAANGVPWNTPDRADESVAINLVSPYEAKGLEYDAVVVIEPEAIVAMNPRGHRLLFVALTRTTRFLDIVCVGDPLPSTPPAPPAPHIPQQRRTDEPTVDFSQAEAVAAQIAAMVAGNAPAPLWDEVLARAAAILDRQAGTVRATGRHRRD